MSSADGSDNIETAPPPAVSSLRSKFERLAADSSTAPSTLKPSSSHLTASPVPPSPRLSASPIPPSPRLRPTFEHDREPSDSSIHSLRLASSSSDLKAPTKRPPPPPPQRPPSRAPSPAPPRSSPLLRPVFDTAQPNVDQDTSVDILAATPKASLARRPPPPPPQEHRSPGVPSLIKQFGNGVAPPPPISPKPFARPSTQPNTSGLPTQPPPEPPYARRPRQSFPPEHVAAHPANAYLSPTAPADGYDPFDDVHSDAESAPSAPPPLPRRNDTLSRHTPELSTDSTSSSARSSSSPASSDNESTSGPSPPLPPPSSHNYQRSPLVPPPRPPRHKVTLQMNPVLSTSPAPLSDSPVNPPPLPARKTPIDDSPPRSLPSRHQSMPDPDLQSLAGSSTQSMPERKQFGNHLPPPTRTIALGDKLPPPRRLSSGSSSESEEEDEEDVKLKIDLLPDASRASRRPPTADCHKYSEFHIHVPAYTATVAVSGQAVAVATHHHLRIYDLSRSDSPIWNLDSKANGFDIKLKDFKMTSVEFRPAASHEDRGWFLWVGTKEGHLIELDVRTGKVTGWRPAIHAHTVTHMFRYSQSMITCDGTGKVLVWSPPEGIDLDIRSQTPRVVRVADKQEWMQMLGGQLWTSTRDPNGGGAGPGASKGPFVRVYDIFTPGSVGRSLLPTEHLGAVTAATILPTQPSQVYMGHEGGHISIWSLGSSETPPQCTEVMKVSTSDILSLEGVNARLWAGTRKGTIEAFDVSSKPWTVTNNWMAHQKLPVLRISVDTWSMEKLSKLLVYSVGRDERIRFWDGLLGIDWIEQAMMKREAEFNTFRTMTALIVSWNVDSAKPDALTGTAENVNFLQEVLQSMDTSPDIIAFGFQELIDLESRKMAAKTVLLGGKKHADGVMSQKVSTSYKKWYDRLTLSVRLAMPPDEPYSVVHAENLVGLFSCIFVKNSEKAALSHAALTTLKRGMGGRYGNKGAIIARFVLDDTSVCFINCHLAAGQHHVRQRNADAAAILEDKTLLPDAAPLEEIVAYVNGGDGSMVLDHEIVFLNGDMNYRIDQRRDAVIAAIKAGDLELLLVHDQLRKELKYNRAFRLRHFSEGPLEFAPTYKYDRRSDEYDTSEKARVPAWCDRVLWRSLHPERVEQVHYRRWEANVSDHRPISAAFKIRVRRVKTEARARVRAEATEEWRHVEQQLLCEAMQYYIDQQMI